MDFPKLYPTVESLPDEPIRLKTHRSQRRSVAIAFYGILLVSVVVYFVFVAAFQGPMLRQRLWVVFGCAVMFGLPYLLLPLTKWNVEISREGIRNFGRFRSAQLFRWDDFRQQRVQEGLDFHSYFLSDPSTDSPRTGSLAVMDMGEDLEQWLFDLIRSVWVRPEPPPPPAFVFSQLFNLSQVLGFRNSPLFVASERGITILIGNVDAINRRCRELESLQTELVKVQVDEYFLDILGETRDDSESNDLKESISDAPVRRREILERVESIENDAQEPRRPWCDVQSIELWPLEHGRSDFVQMSIKLPDRELEWRDKIPGRESGANFRDTFPTELMSMIRAYVPADRFTTTAYIGEPLTLAEWERRYERFVHARQRGLPATIHYASVLVPVFAVLAILAGGWDKIVAPIVAMYIFLGPLVYGLWYFNRRELRSLERQYAEWRLLFGAGRPEESPQLNPPDEPL